MDDPSTPHPEAADRGPGARAEFSDVEREVLHRIIRARRDIRKFKPTPVPPEVLARILEAAQAAPSVGLSQPWDFILLELPTIRKQIRDCFERVNLEQKQQLQGTKRGELYNSLKLEGILESPLNIAVTCDHSRGGSFVLGKGPMPQTAVFSVCLAIQNLWLAARAEGVGVGWVSILNQSEAETLLGLPPGVELVGYLCVGYPLEFRSVPMLEEVGWKNRTHLESQVFQDRWGVPARPVSNSVESSQEAVVPADFAALAQKKIDSKTKPPGSLGMLESAAVRLAGIQRTLNPRVERKRICVYAGSHGITQEGVSAYPAEVTSQMVLNFLNGGAAINVLARHAGIQVHVIDAGVDTNWPPALLAEPGFFERKVRAGTRNAFRERAMTSAECEQAIEAGREQVRLALEARIELLGIGEMGIGNTTAASALFVALLDFTAEDAVGRGTGINDTALLHKAAVIEGAVNLHRPGAEEPLARYWLEAVGGYEIAAMTGTILEAARVGLPLVVDGFISTAAAAVAFSLDPTCRNVCFFSHRSEERAHGSALNALQVEPLLDLKMRLGEGTGAALAMPLLDAAAKILCEMATFASAGVSDAIGSAP